MSRVIFKLKGTNPYFIVKNVFSLYYENGYYEYRSNDAAFVAPENELTISSNSISFRINNVPELYIWTSHLNKYEHIKKSIGRDPNSEKISVQTLPSKTYDKLLYWLYEHESNGSNLIKGIIHKFTSYPFRRSRLSLSCIFLTNDEHRLIRFGEKQIEDNFVTNIVLTSDVCIIETKTKTHLYSFGFKKSVSKGKYQIHRNFHANYFRYLRLQIQLYEKQIKKHVKKNSSSSRSTQ